MTIWSWRHAIQTAPLEAPTKLVLLNLSIYHNDRGEGFWPGHERQAIDTGLSKRTVIAHINKAVAAGFLIKQARFKEDGSQTSNCYFPAIPNLSGGVQQVHGGSAVDALGGVQDVHPILSNKILSKDNIYSEAPEWVPSDAWQSYVDMRKEKKKPLTKAALRLTFAKLEKFKQQGLNIEEILNQSTLNSWTGIFAPKNTHPPRYGPPPSQNKGGRKPNPQNMEL